MLTGCTTGSLSPISMWEFFDTKMLYRDDRKGTYEWNPLYFVTWITHRNILTVPSSNTDWNWYDSWVSDHLVWDELALVAKCIQMAQNNPSYFVHIRGISLAESVEMLCEYYETLGFRDMELKNFHLSPYTQVTASISLRHALWCEKDKNFLDTRDGNDKAYGMLLPPIRGSHDLRRLQQALRMNCLLWIEVYPDDEKYIKDLLTREILPPFLIAQMVRFRWNYFAN